MEGEDRFDYKGKFDSRGAIERHYSTQRFLRVISEVPNMALSRSVLLSSIVGTERACD